MLNALIYILYTVCVTRTILASKNTKENRGFQLLALNGARYRMAPGKARYRMVPGKATFDVVDFEFVISNQVLDDFVTKINEWRVFKLSLIQRDQY